MKLGGQALFAGEMARGGSEILLHHSAIVKSWSQDVATGKAALCGLRLVVVYIRAVTLDFGKVLGETLDHFALLAVG